MSEPLYLVLTIFLLLLANGFFSGGEIAIISARRSRIEALVAEGSKGAARVQRLQDDMHQFLATVQIGVTVMGTLSGVVGGYLASRHLQPHFEGWALARWVPAAFVASSIVGVSIVYVGLILGELVPKTLALRYSEAVALLASWPLSVIARTSRWVVVLLTASTRGVLAVFGIKDVGTQSFVSEEEIMHMVREGRQQGVLDQTEMELIRSVFEFTDTPVRKVMVPRPKIFGLDVNTPPTSVGGLIVEAGFSRIPAFDGSIDNVVGLVYVKDALRLMEKREPVLMRRILHPVHFVPETKKVGALLKELQKRRTHMAMVIDEHGSVTGLVTLEDLLEEIVGDIKDEYDWEERPVERLRDGSMIVEGTVSAAELRETYGVPLPESEEFQTVAGFMLARLGAVPKGGEVVPLGEHRLTVVDVEKNRISKVKIEKGPPAAGGG